MIKNQLEKGFILFITLMMLIIFAIVGISLYQQTSIATLNVQYVTFKQEAEDLAMHALNALEEGINAEVGSGNTSTVYSRRPLCGELSIENGVEKPIYEPYRCDNITDLEINTALSELKSGKKTLSGDWERLTDEDFVGSFSGDGGAYYIIQQLGRDSQNIGYLLYRITIIAQILDTYNIISAVTAVPEN